MRNIKLLIFFFSIFALFESKAQGTFDCNTSTITACNGNPTFPFTNNSGVNDYGNVMDLPNNTTSSVSNPATNPVSTNSGCLLSGELNPTWVVINISAPGTLEFTISQTGFTDWAMWPYNASNPANTCNGIANNQIAPIRCNWNISNTGGTGIGTPPAGADAGNFEPTLNVNAGDAFIICVSNFSNVQSTVSMNFGGTAGTSCVPNSGAIGNAICPGGTATISASTSLANPSFTWNPGGLTGQSVSVSPSSTTVYTVTIVGTNTVTSAITTQTNTSTVTIHNVPTPTLSSNSMVCPNSPINLTASSGFTNYTWTSPVSTQTTAAGSLSIPNANPALAGTYTVIGRTAQGCTATATAVVDLIPTSPIAVTANPNACQGGVINLTANAPGATGYSWTGPLAYSSTLQNPVLNNVQPNQAGVYTVTATFSGTGPNTCTTTNTSTVSVVPAGTVLINPIADVCHNATINFTGPNGGTQYDWTGPAGFSSSLQNPSIANADVIHQGIYNLSITTNGCVNTGSVNVTVYNPLSFSSSPVNITLCAGKTGTIAAAGFGGSGTYNYQWTPATDLAAPNSPFTTVTGNTTITYTLTASDANCPVTIPVSVPVTVSVNPTPIITMSVSSQRGCEPHCVDLISISNPASASCVWRFTNNLGNNNCNVSNFCFPSRGNYNAWLSVTDVNGCVDSIQQNSFVVVDPVPLADFTWFPENPNILINEVSFTDQSSVGLPITDWRWSFGDYFANGADTSDLQNPSYVYDNVGTYPVTLGVTNSFGCISSVTKNMVIEDEFAIYIPNTFTPTKPEGKNDIFNVQGMGFRAEGFEMRIFDRWGNLIFKTNDVYKGWDGSIKGGPPVQGVYVYKIKVFDYKKREKEFVGYISAL